MSNKVQFGLKNVYYAILTESDSAAPSWGTPVKVPGAVNLELSSENADNTFYADNIAYYKTYANNGYTGSLEMAKIPDAMLKDVWGFTEESTDHVMMENVEAEPKPFALLFQIDGDEEEDFFVFYRCFGSRPAVASATIADGGKEPQTQSIDISALPVIDNSTGGTMDGMVFAKTNASTTTTVKNGWFSTVYTA